MLTTNVMGGLGNQLFQIFALINLSLKNKIAFYFEKDDSKRTPGITNRPYYWENFLKTLKPFVKPSAECLVYREKTFKYEDIPVHLFPKDKNIKLFGYYQSYKYFQENEKQIFKLIKLREQQETLLNNFPDKYFDNTVSVHFRIGDYKKIQQHHPLQTLEYYKKALDKLILDTQKDDWKILLFYELKDKTDVYSIVNKLKEQYVNLIFCEIDHNLSDWEQMLSMSLCTHNIIANSTYSWWGAYFNDNQKNVYYPKTWFGPAQGNKNNELEDLFKSSWICIT